MTDNDHPYKRLFSHPEMVMDLVRGFCPGLDVGLVEGSLERVEGSFVTDEWKDRESDVIWSARWGNINLVLYLLIEFQSSVDPGMLERLLAYTGLLYQLLRKSQRITSDQPLPLVVPIVLYNGEPPWTVPLDLGEAIGPLPKELERFRPHFRYLLLDEVRIETGSDPLLRNLAAAVFRLEQASTHDDLFAVGLHTRALLAARGITNLTLEFEQWYGRTLISAPGPLLNPFQGEPMLAERMKRWIAEIEHRGEVRGLAEGEARGLAEGEARGEAGGRILAIRDQLADGVIRVDQAIAFLHRLHERGIITADRLQEELQRLG